MMPKFAIPILASFILVASVFAFERSALAEDRSGDSVQGVSIITSFALRNDVMRTERLDDTEQDELMSHLDLNLGVGYTWAHGFHCGFSFLRHQEAFLVNDNDGTEAALRSSYVGVGPRFGYESSFGLRIYYSYLIQTKTTVSRLDNTPSEKFESERIIRDTYGHLFELSYAMPLWRFVAIGPQINYMRRGYRSSKLNEQVDGVEQPEVEHRGVYRRTILQPQLAIWFKF